MEILLDGNKIIDKNSLFISLKEQINSEEFHGNNLDALWDVLSCNNNNLVVTITNKDKLEANLGEYLTILLDLFNELISPDREVTINLI